MKNMVEISHKEYQEKMEILEGEVVKLDVDTVKMFEQTPATGYKGIITISYQEVKL